MKVRGRRPRSRAQIIDYLAANFEVNDEGCWIWTRTINRDGYGLASWTREGRLFSFAHQVVLAALGQPVPRGLVVDHLCRERACMNPDHLDTVTQRENTMRSPIALGAVNAAKTHCAKGHPYTAENTRTYYGIGGRKTWQRLCRSCEHEAYLRRRDARVGAS